MTRKIAVCFILIAGILWGSMGIFVRQYTKAGLSSMDIVAVRSVVTTVMMFLYLLFTDRKRFQLRIKDSWCFFGTGLLSILFFNLCYFKAIIITSMSVAAVLLYTAPAIVIILSGILFREKITSVKIIALIMTVSGCILVTGVIGNSGSLSLAGVLTGLGAGLGYALYSIFSRYALERGYHIYTIIFYTFLITTIGMIPFAGWKKMGEVCITNGSYLLFSLVFGLISTVLPYILYTIGLKGTENGKAAIIASVEPVVATVIGTVIFHEKLTIGGVIGTILVLSGIIICNIGKKPSKTTPKK